MWFILNCMDPATLLAAIEAAITALLTGGASSYSIGSRNVTKLDLATLMQERRLLLREVANSSGSGAFSLGSVGGRR